MAASDVRAVVLRALFEPEYLSQLAANPATALQDYNLTKEESDALTKPGPDLYRLIQQADPEPSSPDGPVISLHFHCPPGTTTTVVVVSYAAAGSLFGARTTWEIDIYEPLINAIKTSSGSARYAAISALVNQLTRSR
jgi:hypothetical protein